MLPHPQILIELCNGLKQPLKKPGSFSEKDIKELETLRPIWLNLIEWARKGQRKPLRDACHRALFPIRPEETALLQKVGALNRPPERSGHLGGFAKLGGAFVERTHGEPGRVYNSMMASFLYWSLLSESGFDWASVQPCLYCENYFLKKRQRGKPQRYCSKECRSAANQRPYDPTKDRIRMRIYHRAKWLSQQSPLTPKKIHKDLIKRHGKDIKRLKLHPERWKYLKEEGR